MGKKKSNANAEPASISASELCAITGLTDRRHRQLATAGYFPPPIDGQYQMPAVLTGMIRYQRELLNKKDGRLAEEKIGLAKANRLTIEKDLAIKNERYIERSAIGPALRNISLHQRTELQKVLEQELTPKLAGLTTLEILPLMRNVVDRICSTFRERTAQWMEAPPGIDTGPLAECQAPPNSSSTPSAPHGPNHSEARSTNTEPGLICRTATQSEAISISRPPRT